mmetsp:Transcript_28933/g.35187  ORF Transcript_28933/g.35187 Transcript_28933/m.35187 type:complete len:137 (+) Transcript_28933:42-452(+)
MSNPKRAVSHLTRTARRNANKAFLVVYFGAVFFVGAFFKYNTYSISSIIDGSESESIKLVGEVGVHGNTSAHEEVEAQEEKKLICVMHVGPHKTSTTSLQLFLYRYNKSVKEAMEEDNYYVPRNGGNHNGLVLCSR